MHPSAAPAAPSILAIAAHPDDSESWCAGTLALASAAGASVRLLLVTAGEQGADSPTVTRAHMAARREAEARTAAATLGLAEVICLHYPDGEVENTRVLRADLVRWLRLWRPTVVFTHDPERPEPPYLSHRDHRSVGRAVLDAVYPLARDRLAFADMPMVADLAPHLVEQVWLFASAGADTLVDISATFARKLAARLAHHSQTTDPAQLAKDWQTRAARIGAPLGFSAAEAFTVLTLT